MPYGRTAVSTAAYHVDTHIDTMCGFVDVSVDDVVRTVAALRAEGSDLTAVEAKRATGGYPTTVAATLCAFGNTPGGGVLILGLDEEAGFAATGVYDVAACKKALASQARQAVRPPVVLSEIEHVELEGAVLVVARVDETSPSSKPCRLASSGKAYLRSYDGDYMLSEAEEQGFLTARTTPTFDREPVPGTSIADLHSGYLSSYLAECRDSSTALRDFDDDEVLFRTGVTTTGARGDARVLTVAGLLALGAYPQQHLPNCVVQASVAPRSEDPSGTRASDVRRFDGPLPMMLDEARAWVRRNTRTRVRFDTDGQGRDEPEFPAEAVRELLSNALIHRDLGPHALVQAITLKLDGQQLVLMNPGGLWRVTLDRLGHEGVTSARNGALLRICQNVRTREGTRAVEALATGIPTVLAALQRAGTAPPRFYDQGIRFTVTVPSHTSTRPSGPAPATGTAPVGIITDLLHEGARTAEELSALTGLSKRQVTYALAALRARGAVVLRGGRGQRESRYELASDR